MKVRDVIKEIERDGWVLDRTRGDHRQSLTRLGPKPERSRFRATPETTCRRAR